MRNKKVILVLLMLFILIGTLFAKDTEKVAYPKTSFGATGNVSFLLGKNEDTFGEKKLTTLEFGLECEKWWASFIGFSTTAKGSYSLSPFYEEEYEAKKALDFGFGITLNIKIPMGKHFSIVAKLGASVLNRSENKNSSDSVRLTGTLSSLSGDAIIVFRMTTGEYKGLFLDIGASGSYPFMNYATYRSDDKDNKTYASTSKEIEDFKGFFLSPYIALGLTF